MKEKSPPKKKQTWSLGRAHWMQFHNFRKKVKLQQQCGTKTQSKKHTTSQSKPYYKQQRKPSPKFSQRMKKRSPAAWWNEDVKGKIEY